MTSLWVLVVFAQCEVHSAHFSPREAVALRFEDGTSWGALEPSSRRSNALTATFDAGGGVQVKVAGGGQHISARVSDCDVYLDTPRDFGWGFTSSASTRLRVEQVSDAGVLLSVASRVDVQPVQTMALARALVATSATVQIICRLIDTGRAARHSPTAARCRWGACAPEHQPKRREEGTGQERGVARSCS